MSQQISLKEAERKVFKTAASDGLWDIFLGCYFLLFVIGPFLSKSLGDFWSVMVFLPFWLGVYLMILLVRKYVVAPRIGTVKFGPARKSKLMRFSVMMTILNIVALVFGILAAIRFATIPGQIYSIGLGFMLLIGFSLAAFFLEVNRLYLYGLLIGCSPLIGEWLWSIGKVSHHGFPVMFGIVSGLMILIGLGIFINLLRTNPLPHDESMLKEA